MKKIVVIIFILIRITAEAQTLAPTPPMGWMTWNKFGVNINEDLIKEIADSMVANGMQKAGYEYIIIDDGWQGGRDKRNNIIPDPEKFPSGMKSLAEYVHCKGLKLGIYSDASQKTCCGFTASLGFEQQDANTFAEWGIDYLKYDYCNAPEDSVTAKTRYKAMADALNNCGRGIVFAVCEWGHRYPWNWASKIGAQVWRTAGDSRDKWKDDDPNRRPPWVGAYGIIDIIDDNSVLSKYAGPGKWNDMDMLVVGLNGKGGPSSEKDGYGCTEIEYQTQMSMWCMMASPLTASSDIRYMDDFTKRILLNDEIIAINQDVLGKQAELKFTDDVWYIFLKPLANGDYALSVLNKSDTSQKYKIDLKNLDLDGQYSFYDVWSHEEINSTKLLVQTHETKVLRLKKQ